ncbi:MAG: hypothetical protein V7637_4453 [Mycobacteriales bacterium]|jgi:dienelactone hydrolase
MSSTPSATTSGAATYDPFIRGRFPVGVRTLQAHDPTRQRLFPVEVWYPAADRHTGQDTAAQTQDVFVATDGVRRPQLAVRDAGARPGTYPLVVFSHSSLGHRRAATFLCTHLSSHGYLVAALDHSESIAPELALGDDTGPQRDTRLAGWITSRVPDVRFLLDHLLDNGGWGSPAAPDAGRVGIVGHSFGGWTALAAAGVEPRIRSVVALAPAGTANPRPGVIPVPLAFARDRAVPTLYLAADQDTPLPLADIREQFDRTPPPKQLVILNRADHWHFADDVETAHEAFRTGPVTGEAAWIPAAMRPITELCSGAQAHLFVRGLTVAHLDATLGQDNNAARLLAGDLVAELAARGVEVTRDTEEAAVHRGHPSFPPTA